MSVLTDDSPVVTTPDTSVPPRHTTVLSLVLALVAAITAALTFFVPDFLLGPPVTNGNARGTALVMLAVGVPVLLIAMQFGRRGSWRAVYFWLGSMFYLAYNAFLLLFLTPFNRLFLLNVATESLAIFAIFSLFLALDREWLVDQMRKIPYRGLAVFVGAIVALNILAWLREVVPAILADNPLSFLEGTGVATNGLYVQDLVFWLPMMAVAAWWVWQRKGTGVLLTGSWLLFGVIESIGIAVDQWFGHQADPASSFASEAVIPFMIGLAVVNAIAVYFYVRPNRQKRASSSTPSPNGRHAIAAP